MPANLDDEKCDAVADVISYLLNRAEERRQQNPDGAASSTQKANPALTGETLPQTKSTKIGRKRRVK
ncbi:MAG: hypothetical protein KJ077_32815 [Anaerolineae bacterium]|nr:hypothetical protein [Anaerolineae bacterium]